MSISRIKWSIYILLLSFGLIALCQQYIVELYMRMYLRNTNYVVSLSTTPYRINAIRPTIENLFAQNLPPKAVYLSVPYLFKRDNLEYVIPEWLANDSRITILRTEDYGPATKLLGVLKQTDLDPDTIIVTVDDDIIYPKHALLHLIYKAATNPDTAYGFAGVNLQYNVAGLVADDVKNGVIPIYHGDRDVTVLQGFGGVAYRRKFFDDSIFEISNAPPECINSDDLYLSFHLAKKNITRRILKNKYINNFMIDYTTEIGHDEHALHNLTPTPAQKHRTCVQFMRDVDSGVVF